MLPPHPKVLAAFALIITAVVSVTHWATARKITDNQRLHLQQQLSQLLPADSFDNSLHNTAIIITDQTSGQHRTIYTASLNGKPTAAIITATALDGYVNDINLLIGINKSGTIAAVRVAEHLETPGLGDKIEYRRSDWITSFDGYSASDPIVWSVKKDRGEFDQLTGATITSRAVVRAVRDTLTFFNHNRERLFPDT